MYTERFKSKEDIYNYLQSYSGAVLSTVSPEGEPYGAVIYFDVDFDLNFFFFAKAGTTKSQNLEKNNKASLTFLDPVEPKTIQARGRVEIVHDSALYAQISDNFNKARAEGRKGLYSPLPVSKISSMTELLLFKFIPNWMRYGDFSESLDPTEATRKVFYQVIPDPSC